MQQTKLVQLLRCFSEKELKLFDSFIESPFHNRSERLIKLYRLLAAHGPMFDSEKLDKEKVFAKMYDKAKYNDLTMRELTSSLYQLTKEFIAIEQVRRDELEKSQERYYWLVQKGNIKQREQEIEFGERLLGNMHVKDHNYYMHRWFNDFYKFEHTTETFRDLEHKWISEHGIGAHLHSLNKLYLFRFFESHHYILNWAYIYNQEFDTTLFEHLEPLARKYIGKGDKVLDLYYNLVQLTKTSEERYFFELKSIFFENDPSVPLDLKANVSIGLENYGTKRMREGDRRYVDELMQIYKYAIKNEFASSKKGMPYLFYMNVAVTAFDAEEIEWAGQFIDEFKNKLDKNLRDDVYQYCKAYWLFEKKQFDEALKLALNVNTTIYFSKIELKGLIARIHFELGMYDQVEVMLESYKYYMAEGKLSQTRKEMYSNFIEVTRQIMRLLQNYSAEECARLMKRIDEAQYMAYRRWIRGTINEIERKKRKVKI